jgi:NAD-dependent deacetylase
MTVPSFFSKFPSLRPFLFFPLSSLALSSRAGESSWTDAAIRASDLIKDAQSVLFVTGAGISAESGLPTYRGVSGLYNDGGAALEEDGMSIEECLSASVFRENPSLTWKYLLQIERACRGAQPSKAHKLLAQAERHVPRVAVFTQNVDGLHDRAGTTNVLSLHGNLHKLVCSKCGNTQMVETFAQFDDAQTQIPPVCESCGGTIRPAVVLFDEYLGDETVANYEKELGMSMTNLMWSWGADRPLKERPFDVSISIGTSALFAYVNAAALSGRRTIEINPCRTNLSGMVDVQVSAGATEALEFIFKRLGWDT